MVFFLSHFTVRGPRGTLYVHCQTPNPGTKTVIDTVKESWFALWPQFFKNTDSEPTLKIYL